MTPLVTIGITTYNAKDTVGRAISSALSQTWPNKEIVIYDDASTDGTPDILMEWQKKNPALKIILGQKNKGVAQARNRLVDAATGDFLAFFDDDDESIPERIQKQYEAVIQAEKIHERVICHTARRQIYPGGAERIEPTVMNAGGTDMALRILCGRPVAGGFGSMPTCSQMARVTTYRGLGGFDENFTRSEDTELNVRHARSGGWFVGLAEPMVIQTMTHGNEKTLQAEENMHLQLLEKHKDFIEQYDCYSACRDWVEIKHQYLRGKKRVFIARIISLFLRHPFFVIKRVMWALPNRSFHTRQRDFLSGRGAV